MDLEEEMSNGTDAPTGAIADAPNVPGDDFMASFRWFVNHRKAARRRLARVSLMEQNPLWLAEYEAKRTLVMERFRRKATFYLRG